MNLKHLSKQVSDIFGRIFMPPILVIAISVAMCVAVLMSGISWVVSGDTEKYTLGDTIPNLDKQCDKYGGAVGCFAIWMCYSLMFVLVIGIVLLKQTYK